MLKLWIRDKTTGKVREYGTNHHDSLIVDESGRIRYLNLQNCCGSGFGPDSEYDIVPNPDDKGMEEIYEMDGTIDIGGYHTAKEYRKMRKDKRKLDKKICKALHKHDGKKCHRLCLGCRHHITTLS